MNKRRGDLLANISRDHIQVASYMYVCIYMHTIYLAVTLTLFAVQTRSGLCHYRLSFSTLFFFRIMPDTMRVESLKKKTEPAFNKTPERSDRLALCRYQTRSQKRAGIVCLMPQNRSLETRFISNGCNTLLRSSHAHPILGARSITFGSTC